MASGRGFLLPPAGVQEPHAGSRGGAPLGEPRGHSAPGRALRLAAVPSPSLFPLPWPRGGSTESHSQPCPRRKTAGLSFPHEHRKACRAAGPGHKPEGPSVQGPPRPLPPPPRCSALCVCVVGGGGGLRPALGSLDLRSSSPEKPQRPKPLPLHGALGKTFKRQTRVTSAVIPLKHSGPGVCPHWPRAPTRRPPGTASKSEPRPL